MALREPLQYTMLSGVDTIGPIAEPFRLSQEFLFINGEKKLRSVGGVTRDYSVEASNPGNPNDYDTIVLEVPIADDADVIELIINDPDLVPETLDSKLDAILTAVTGSWIWDKSTGIMTMFDASGTERFKFEVSDSAESASQERRQDLEV